MRDTRPHGRKIFGLQLLQLLCPLLGMLGLLVIIIGAAFGEESWFLRTLLIIGGLAVGAWSIFLFDWSRNLINRLS